MNPPDDSLCWAGQWSPVEPMVNLWAHSAVIRTVAALPSLHAWRLGDTKGSRRSLLWSAAAEPEPGVAVDMSEDGLAVFTQTAPPPSLPLGDVGPNGELVGGAAISAADSMTSGLLSALASGLTRSLADAVADRVAPDSNDGATAPRPGREASPYRPLDAGVRRWVGGLAQLPGSWLPEVAILPQSRRGIDDPATRWGTESVAFALRHSVHAVDTRFASDLLAPHVTALILDHVPDDAAVTVAGDAVHVWWEYSADNRSARGKALRTVEVADRIRDALPSFVLADHPDHSHRVEERLAERAAQAAAYRAGRVTGRHQDPTLQRIYAQAQASYQLGQREG